MAWQNLEVPIVLKPVTDLYLADRRTVYTACKSTSESPQLTWKEFEQDAQVFSGLLEKVWESRGTTDKRFIEKIHPEVIAILQKAEIFRRLASEDIIVTAQHNGTVPFQHTKNVLEVMKAEGAGLNSNQKFVIRTVGYIHDIGKAISAGIPKAEAQEILNLWGGKHSYPNHDAISALVLEALENHSSVQQWIQIIGQRNWQLIKLVVRNHHLLEANIVRDTDKFEALERSVRPLAADPLQYEAFMLTFVFAYADINSNLNYRKYWPQKVTGLELLFQKVADAFSLETLLRSKQILACLPPRKAAVNSDSNHQS